MVPLLRAHRLNRALRNLHRLCAAGMRVRPQEGINFHALQGRQGTELQSATPRKGFMCRPSPFTQYPLTCKVCVQVHARCARCVLPLLQCQDGHGALLPDAKVLR